MIGFLIWWLVLSVYFFLNVQSHYICNNHYFGVEMEKKSGKHNEKDKPNWDWMHIQCYLKTVETNRKSIIWNLAPSIILTNPSSDNSGPTVRLYIDTEKSLQYSNELGWNWHKSWNIPNISLRLEIKDEGNGDFLLSPRNLYAQIFAVKKNTESQKCERMTLIDVGIRGESKMEMIDGQVYFSAIKFSSTTYNNEGINFNLLIVLYINQGQFQKPKVLTAVISPPIFVDSRRSARDYQEKKFSSFVEPFGYDNIEKEFIKRQNKSKCESEIIIKNDPEGFYNYITAPNIRHKVKHPVFLAIKFSNCVKIYYHSKLVDPSNMNELLENLQTRLLKENKTKQKNEGELNVNLDDKYFIFVVSSLTDSLKRKKVIQSIETMQNQYIGITCSKQELSQQFLPLESIELIKKSYKETYESLINICQNYEPEYPSESDQYYSDQYDDSENPNSSNKKKDNGSDAPALKNTAGKAQPQQPQNKTTIITNKHINNNDQHPKEKEQHVKKEELFESQFQAPVFFPQQQHHQNQPQQFLNNPPNKKTSSSSAFNKAVGFRNVNDNNPVFDTSLLNKSFANNMANFEYGDLNGSGSYQGMKPNNNIFKNGGNDKLSISSTHGGLPAMNHQQHNISSQQGNNNQMGGNNQYGGGGNSSIYDNLLYSNLMLTNWLGSVKNNNNSLFENMCNNTMTDQLIHKNNMDRLMQVDQQQKILEMNKMPLQSEEQQSIVSLIQQIGLYKELLSQVTYQNQLLTRDISFKQVNSQHNMGQFGQMGGMNFLNSMAGMQGANGMQGNSLPGMQSNGLSTIQGNGMSGMSNNMNVMSNNMNGMPNSMSGMTNMSNGMSGMTNNSMGNMSTNIPNNSLASMMGSSNSMMGMGNQLGMPSMMGMGLGQQKEKDKDQMMSLSTNYEIIKNMVLEEMKKEAENKEKMMELQKRQI